MLQNLRNLFLAYETVFHHFETVYHWKKRYTCLCSETVYSGSSKQKTFCSPLLLAHFICLCVCLFVIAVLLRHQS